MTGFIGEGATERAQTEGLDLLVFPELSLNGYPVGSADFHKCALTPESDVIAKLAVECKGLTTIGGLLEETVAAQFYNSSLTFLRGSDGSDEHQSRTLMS